MNENKKRAAICLLLCAAMSLSACAQDKKEDEKPHALTFGSTEIVVEKTPVSSLYDAGCSTVVANRGANGESSTTNVTGDTRLSANSVYYGFYVMKDGERQMVVDVVTDDEDVTLADAKISAVTVYGDDVSVSNMTFDGVLLTDLTEEKFGELVPESDVGEHSASYRGGDYSLVCKWKDSGELEQLQMERLYTAQYS